LEKPTAIDEIGATSPNFYLAIFDDTFALVKLSSRKAMGDAQIKSLTSAVSHSAGDNFDAFRESFASSE
jgi:hypothetical protein